MLPGYISLSFCPQAKWKTTFKVKNTVNETFYRPGQAPIRVPMMTSKKYPLAFFNDPSLQAKVSPRG